MSPAIAELLYATALRVAVPAYLARLWWRGGAEPPYRAHWGERLGFAPRDGAVPRVPGRLWIHAVSLGETRAAAALIEALRRERPDLRLLLTHGTATGREAGRALLRDGDEQAWLPIDTPGAVERFLRAHRPAIGVMMETEVWPLLLKGAARQGVPMVLANARLSERSLRQGERFGALMRTAASRFGAVLAQTPEDAQRLRRMGARKVSVTGNLKFDMTPSPELLERGREWHLIGERPVVLAASTREGEELLLLRAWQDALTRTATDDAHKPRLWIVPRHPQRFDEVSALVTAQGLSISRRGTWVDGRPPPDALRADVWLGDSIGEMPAYFAAADVALLGGSFAPLGGQNLIEAAACACPLVMGPSTFNFAQAAEASLQAGASLRADDMPAAISSALHLLRDGPQRDAMASAGRVFAEASRGAAQRQARAILVEMDHAP